MKLNETEKKFLEPVSVLARMEVILNALKFEEDLFKRSLDELVEVLETLEERREQLEKEVDDAEERGDKTAHASASKELSELYDALTENEQKETDLSFNITSAQQAIDEVQAIISEIKTSA